MYIPDGEEETAIAWWYNDGEGPTLDIEGEEIDDTELISGVYATNGQPAEIDKD